MTDEQKRNDNRHFFYYRDHNNIRRRYGVYAPAIDRFLHVSGFDIWASLETAEILSSKIQTMVYVLPAGYVSQSDFKEVVSNENCIEWGIYNKLDLKVGGSINVLYARQTPGIGMLYPEDRLERHAELPADFKDNPTMFKKIKAYADYVYPRVVSINLAVCTNPYYSKKFMDKYLDEDWIERTSNKSDPSLSTLGIDFDIKNILYRCDSPEEAEEEIIKYWHGNHYDIAYIMTSYYRMLAQPWPQEIKDLSAVFVHSNHTPFSAG